MSQDQKKSMHVDIELVRQLAAVLDDTNLTEIEVEDGDRKVRVARTVTAAPVAYAAPAPVAAAAAPAAAAPAAEAAAAPAAPSDANAVKSPMVGTAYLSAEPASKPFVSVGDTVTEGQTLLIVEAMKVMNQIAAPRAGRISAIFVQNAEPVEYGQPLVVLD